MDYGGQSTIRHSREAPCLLLSPDSPASLCMGAAADRIRPYSRQTRHAGGRLWRSVSGSSIFVLPPWGSINCSHLECRELQEGIASIGRQSWEGQASDLSVRIAPLNITTTLCEKRYLVVPLHDLLSRVEVVSRSFRGTGFSRFSLKERGLCPTFDTRSIAGRPCQV